MGMEATRWRCWEGFIDLKREKTSKFLVIPSKALGMNGSGDLLIVWKVRGDDSNSETVDSMGFHCRGRHHQEEVQMALERCASPRCSVRGFRDFRHNTDSSLPRIHQRSACRE